MDIEKEINFLAETDNDFAESTAELQYQQDMIKHYKGSYVMYLISLCQKQLKIITLPKVMLTQ